MILSLLFYGFLAYMLYRLVFGFIIPIVRATRQVKKGFRHMQEQMNAQYQAQQEPAYSNTSRQQPGSANNSRAGDEDYLEFEEVK